MTRPNTVAVISPKGGVGKTTISFVLGNLLASQLRMRVVALDANPDFGTLASLAPDDFRSQRSLADLLADSTEIDSPAELHPYVARLPTGLHLLGAPAHAEVMGQMTPGLYSRLLDFLEKFYEVVILDLGTGITDPLAQFAVDRADQTVVITTPEWVTAAGVLGALRYLQLEQGTLVLNQAPGGRHAGNREVVKANFRRHAVETSATIPYDDRLRVMLDTGTYSLDDAQALDPGAGQGARRRDRVQVRLTGGHLARRARRPGCQRLPTGRHRLGRRQSPRPSGPSGRCAAVRWHVAIDAQHRPSLASQMRSSAKRIPNVWTDTVRISSPWSGGSESRRDSPRRRAFRVRASMTVSPFARSVRGRPANRSV